jgi:hypothetical protein
MSELDILLQKVLDTPEECNLLKQFLDEEKASETLLFWVETELFKSIEDPELRKLKKSFKLNY